MLTENISLFMCALNTLRFIFHKSTVLSLLFAIEYHGPEE